MKFQDEGRILANAGYLVDTHAMCWVRNLQSPLDEAWRAVSTLEGLQKWWIVPGCTKTFELKPGGVFAHHWTNEVQRFQEAEYIDFRAYPFSLAGTGGMRFELTPLGAEITRFSFLDTWAPDAQPGQGPAEQIAQPGGAGTPWSGVAAGWHRMIDQLETVLGRAGGFPSYDQLCTFYARHLTDLYRWREMVQHASK